MKINEVMNTSVDYYGPKHGHGGVIYEFQVNNYIYYLNFMFVTSSQFAIRTLLWDTQESVKPEMEEQAIRKFDELYGDSTMYFMGLALMNENDTESMNAIANFTDQSIKYKVFSTVNQIVLDFLSQNQIDYITIPAKEQSRVPVYKRIIKNMGGSYTLLNDQIELNFPFTIFVVDTN